METICEFLVLKSLKNILIKSLVYLLRSKKPVASIHPMQFLVVSTTALGDTLWATPAIKALRETHPDSFISILTSSIGKQVLLHNPYIDELLLVKNPALSSLFSLYRRLKNRKFTHVFLLHASQRSVLPFVSLLGNPIIIGTAGINKGLDSLLTEAQPLNLKTHEIERRLKIVACVGAHTSVPEMDLFLQPSEEAEAQKWLDSLLIPSYLPLIALHPGSKDAFRRWPASHFIELGNRLTAHLGCKIFVTGVASERDLVKDIASKIDGAIVTTDLPLRIFAALMKKMRLIVVNDTGPMHIAFAMKTPTIALFVPSDPDRFGPYGVKKVKVIAKSASCTPCLKRKCPASFCFLQIGVQEVYDAALQLFYKDLLLN